MKTGSYLANVLARRELAHRGLGEGVMLGIDGSVVSGTASNVYVVRHGRVITPSLASGCRPGVVREALLESDQLILEGKLDVTSLEEADEIFFTSSQVGVLSAATFEGRALGRDRANVIRDSFVRMLRA
jgi:branched-subunit amino acid aminotransferase/4-amino-4-deoxychorismate lyase